MRVFIFLFGLGLSFTTTAANIDWHWEDRFEPRETRGLKRWIEHADAGLQALFGPLPFRYRAHFHRSGYSWEPVPWAQTRKGNGRAVHFHVDLRHGWDKFRRDWTAAHEISHLMFPYLGEDSRWFAEGIASYLQYQIMYANGTLRWAQVTDKLEERFRSTRKSRAGAGLSLVEHSRQLQREGGKPRLYWAGAAYFLNVDQRLYEAHGIRLTDVIRDYVQSRPRLWGMDARGMIREFDKISAGRVFSQAYQQLARRRIYPPTTVALGWLRRHPPVLRSER